MIDTSLQRVENPCRGKGILGRAMFIPSYQNFTCLQCGLCCRSLFVPVSREEKERLARFAAPKDPFFVHGDTTFLARTQDGRCTFLDEDNLCSIHKNHGPDAKPLTCRAFPIKFSLREDEVAVGVRFDCPATAGNRGQPLSGSTPDLHALSKEVAEKTSGLRPGSWPVWRGLTGPDLTGILDALTETILVKRPLQATSVACIRLFEVLKLQEGEGLFSGAGLKKISSLRTTFLDGEARRSQATTQSPSRSERSLFFQLLAQYARRDAEREEDFGILARIHHTWAAYQVLWRRGSLSSLGKDLPDVCLPAIEDPLRPPKQGDLEPILRFLRLKMDTRQFYGPIHHGFGLEEGLRSLCLAFPVLCAFARLYAHARRGPEGSREDVIQAVQLVDHNFSQLGAFRFRKFRRISRKLTESNTLRRLCLTYGL